MSVIDEAYRKVDVVINAIEMLEDGFPLDKNTLDKLKELGIDCDQFIRRFEIKTTD